MVQSLGQLAAGLPGFGRIRAQGGQAAPCRRSEAGFKGAFQRCGGIDAAQPDIVVIGVVEPVGQRLLQRRRAGFRHADMEEEGHGRVFTALLALRQEGGKFFDIGVVVEEGGRRGSGRGGCGFWRGGSLVSNPREKDQRGQAPNFRQRVHSLGLA